MIKLIAVDLDGTLFAENLVVAEPTREAIRAAQERGVHVTLATGRMVRSVLPIAADLGIYSPVICYQGSIVYDPREGRSLLHYRISRETTLQIIEFVHSRGMFCNAYIDDNLYVAATNPGTEFYASLNVGLPINPVGDLYSFVAESENMPTKMSVVLDGEEATDALVAALQEQFGAGIYAVKSHPRFAETVNPEANKAVALATVAASLGIAREEVMAVGDGANDIPMLEWAGLGVAMGQAKPVVKAVADYVTAPLPEFGLARAIEKFVLNGHAE